MKFPSTRITYLTGFISIVILLALAFYLEKHKGISPCPLCILQRLSMGLLGIVFFFGAVLSLKKLGNFIISSLAFLISLSGLIFSIRQVWLQHLPANMRGDCGVSLQYMLHAMPFDQVIRKIFEGSAECGDPGWAFLNLTLAEWSLLCFAVFVLLSFFQLWRKP